MSHESPTEIPRQTRPISHTLRRNEVQSSAQKELYIENLMIIHRLFLIALLTLVTGCATLQTQNVQPGGLKAYTKAYVEPPSEDEFQVASALIIELSDMGFEISGKPIVSPTDTDLLVIIKPVGGWDMTRYLQSLQIQFIAAKSGRLVSSSSFYSKGLWRGVKDERLNAIFNDIRQKNGYPPSKQFP